MDRQELEQAFSLFNAASDQLTGAYQDLQEQVQRLTAELAVANGELRRQYVEKEALSRRLALILAALPAGVVVLDGAGVVKEANPVARAMLGEVVGVAWIWFASQRLRETLAPGEWELLPGVGKSAPSRVSLMANDLEEESGRIIVLQDITESHNLQRQLERGQRLTAMGEMAAGLAHQLRTPLATALLYTANLAKSSLPEAERTRFAEKSLGRLRHLERLIQDMLLFVKGQSGNPEPVSIESLLLELQAIMDPQMQANGVVFQVKIESSAEVVRVRGNRKALTGALINLLENALQATNKGGVIDLVATCAEGKVILQVRDSGSGMDAETCERIFEPFYTTRTDGTGLGLAIVRGVAESHGGTVSVHSNPGKGTVFMLGLPVDGSEDS